MKWEIRNHPVMGKSLFAENGTVEVGVPLEFGIRVGHFSLCGGENVFFEQPEDMKELTTEEGWRVRGGHRLWLAPESVKVYYPDNESVDYKILENGIELLQQEDPWLHVRKKITISFEEGACVRVKHRIENTGNEKIKCSLWAISSMAPGGTEYIRFELRNGGMDHWHRISMWDYTSMGDNRANYTREEIRIQHQPVSEKYKIGVGHPFGPVWYENQDVVFMKHFAVEADKEYPDGNVSYETFFCKHMVEMESLSPYEEILPGESMEHQELWELQAKK